MLEVSFQKMKDRLEMGLIIRDFIIKVCFLMMTLFYVVTEPVCSDRLSMAVGASRKDGLQVLWGPAGVESRGDDSMIELLVRV